VAEMLLPYLNEAPDIKTFPESMGIRIEQQCMLDGHSTCRHHQHLLTMPKQQITGHRWQKTASTGKGMLRLSDDVGIT
jgi:hypothetical protein